MLLALLHESYGNGFMNEDFTDALNIRLFISQPHYTFIGYVEPNVCSAELPLCILQQLKILLCTSPYQITKSCRVKAVL